MQGSIAGTGMLPVNPATLHGGRGLARMGLAPFTKSAQGPSKTSAELRQRVVNLGRDLLIIPPQHNAIRFKLFQLLNEHFVADVSQASSEVAVSARLVG